MSGTIVTRGALCGVAALIGSALLAVFVLPHPAPAGERLSSRPVAQRLLRFADRDDGAVLVTDVSTGQTVAVVTGQNGFLRCTMGGLARIRMLQGLDEAAPFALTAYADHRLTIADPATHTSIDLEAFGPDNEAVFARLLDEPSVTAVAAESGSERRPD